MNDLSAMILRAVYYVGTSTTSRSEERSCRERVYVSV